VAGSAGSHQFLTSYLINDTVAIDCGSLGFHDDLSAQMRVRHLFLSHSHMDHVASLPVLLENIYDGNADCITVHGSAEVIRSLREDIFNGRVWPDFVGLSEREAPFLRLDTLVAARTVDVEGLRITPVPVTHAVPTMGFIIEDDSAAVVIATDTGPTEAIWHAANRLPHLRAVFLEATFPESMSQLATVSRHLTPRTFVQEMKKVERPCRFLAVHLKPRFRAEVAAELLSLDLPNVEIAEPARVYHFGA
jgi:ribonuclease BN (tRNA processing enzyme)